VAVRSKHWIWLIATVIGLFSILIALALAWVISLVADLRLPWASVFAIVLVVGLALGALTSWLCVRFLSSTLAEIDVGGSSAKGQMGVKQRVQKMSDEWAALQRRNRDLEQLVLAARELDNAASPHAMLDIALGHVAELLPYERAYVALADERLDEWQILVHRGYDPEELTAVEIVRPEAAVGSDGVCLPIRTAMDDLGVIYLESPQPPDEETMHLLRLLVDTVGAAVEKRRLYESTQREVRTLKLLNEAGRVLTSTLDKQEVLTRVMREVTHALNAEAGSVVLVDEERGDMFFAAAASPAADLLLGMRMALDQGIVGWTIQRRESVLVDDAHTDPRFYGQIDVQTGLYTRSVICVPLSTKDRVIGAIEVIDPDASKFTEDDLRLLEALAPHAAVAIDNASLHESLRAQMEELERTQDQLLQAEKLSAIGQLVAGVAHELNNPLTAIVGYSQLLLETCEDEQICEDLTRIEREAQRSARIVQNLLSFARQSKMEKHPIDLRDVLNKTLDLLLYQLEVDNVRVVRDISPFPMTVLGDRYQLQQVFLNLISNAHQSMRKAHGGGGLIVRAYPTEEGMVRAQFVDDGLGIPKEVIGRVFDPFFTTKDVGEGTGLGLSICMGIVQEHQGRIWPESEEGQGATFTVELPLYEGDAKAEEPRRSVYAPVPVGSRSILVVDDEVEILELLKRLLEAEGHVVITADNGIEAQALLDQRDFDLVICDLKMPGINGRELFEYLQARQPQMAERVIFSTGDVVGEESWSFLQSVENPFLSKPFKLEQVLTMVHELWGQRRSNGR